MKDLWVWLAVSVAAAAVVVALVRRRVRDARGAAEDGVALGGVEAEVARSREALREASEIAADEAALEEDVQ